LYELEFNKKHCEFKQQKLILLGEGSVGKTSFLKALTNKSFQVEHHATVGVDLQGIAGDWNSEFKLETMSHDKESLTVFVFVYYCFLKKAKFILK
jgi:signal recognition particle receptor subunit beta